MDTDRADQARSRGGGRESLETSTAELGYHAVPASADRLPALRRALMDWATQAGLSADNVEALGLSSYEAMANVVEHAYTDGDGVLDLTAVCLPAENRVRVTVADRGEWTVPPARPDMRNGRGLPLIRRLADESEVVAGSVGTTVRMWWSLSVAR
ncbi:anti-sigma regulatory factor (Ser/Thr protein kinase) [Halopolyspora algeriensis]|uniref:Anti-sigma regulatory factor (Ser/Thr protein kinase) n=1 Tax=Halopolyspora algeriensis TaxID=1500506 RepID=A0A368VFF6_9ACTN|nr:ATP-binding protein [Halopolyspora algeriensis]RCW39953.1 anti-sigma regulatory factor (Ser/Thr protein kinase) [Halopolyspora algeriensis]TQM46610.1 anti-sigma regulatory factor (Ser/Thr protein kinase) [Halopolyspora algeriensis]